MTYIWYTGNQATADRCCALQDKAFGSSVVRVREDWHAYPGVLWGVPVGAGPDAGTNVGAALVEAIRLDVIAGTSERLTTEEMDELRGYQATATALENTWWWDEQGELARDQ